MENRNLAIGITLAAVVLCGIPGLMGVCFSAFILILNRPVAQLENEWLVSLLLLCGSVFLLAIPIAVGFLVLRKRKPAKTLPPSQEPIPPPS